MLDRKPEIQKPIAKGITLAKVKIYLLLNAFFRVENENYFDEKHAVGRITCLSNNNCHCKSIIPARIKLSEAYIP